MRLFTLKWAKAENGTEGYRIEHAKPDPEAGRGASLLRGNKDRQIVRQGRLIDVQYDENRHHQIYRKLAECRKSEVDVLRFVGTYGFLQSANGKAEYLDGAGGTFELIDNMRSLVAAYDRKDWDAIGNWLERSNQNRLIPSGGVGRLGIIFGGSNGERPGLRFRPANLYNYLVCQLLDDASSGRVFHQCQLPGCGEYFQVGPGSPGNRRITAKYCTPEHKMSAYYAKQKESGK